MNTEVGGMVMELDAGMCRDLEMNMETCTCMDIGMEQDTETDTGVKKKDARVVEMDMETATEMATQ